MATDTVSIVPNGNGTNATFFDSVNNGYATPDDGEFFSTDSSATRYLLLEDMPEAFDTVDSVTIWSRHRTTSAKADNPRFSDIQIVEDDESTAITSAGSAFGDSTTFANYSKSMTITGSTDKATWDGAVLALTFTEGSEGNFELSEIQVDVTYNISLDVVASGGCSCGGSAVLHHTENWYNEDYNYRLPVYVLSSQVDDNLTDFPVYINLSELSFKLFGNAKSDGSDIRVTESDGTTEIPREIVSIDTTSETGQLHFKGDVSSTADTLFFIYYGDSSASEPASDSTNGSEAVWSDYEMVLHLNESVNTDTTGYLDVTGNNNHATGVSMTLSETTGQLAGNCAVFDGTADYMTVTTATSIELTDDFTASCWTKRDADGDFDGFIGKARSGGIGWNLNFRDSNHVYAGLSGAYIHSDMSADPNDFDWHHFVFRRNSGTADVVLDGDPSTATSTATLTESGTDFCIGRFYVDSDSLYLDGKVQEVRYYNGVLSDSWLLTEYNNQNSSSTFYAYEGEESPAAASETYNEIASGGAEVAGDAVVEYVRSEDTYNETATGGAEVAGVSPVDAIHNVIASGGAEVAGEAYNQRVPAGGFPVSDTISVEYLKASSLAIAGGRRMFKQLEKTTTQYSDYGNRQNPLSRV